MDILEQYHLFSRAAAKALNDAKLRPVKDGKDVCCAVLVVVHPTDPEKGAPLGGSLNWVEDKEIWEPMAQIEQPTPYHGD